jgi:hypothetical protein
MAKAKALCSFSPSFGLETLPADCRAAIDPEPLSGAAAAIAARPGVPPDTRAGLRHHRSLSALPCL